MFSFAKEEEVRVYGNAKVYEHATISGIVFGDAEIFGVDCIWDKVYDNTRVYANASIPENAIKQANLEKVELPQRKGRSFRIKKIFINLIRCKRK